MLLEIWCTVVSTKPVHVADRTLLSISIARNRIIISYKQHGAALKSKWEESKLENRRIALPGWRFDAFNLFRILKWPESMLVLLAFQVGVFKQHCRDACVAEDAMDHPE